MKKNVDFYRSESQLMNDAIDRIVVEIYRKKRELGYQTIVLTGCSSEAGTTTNAINLAIALSVAGWKTILVDCDMRKGPDFKRLNEIAKTGLSDFLMDLKDREEIIYGTSYKLLDYIPCGTTSDSPVRLFCSLKMEELVSELKQEYDYIVFDFPSINIVPDANILIPFVDEIALGVALHETTKRQLRDAKQKVKMYQDKYLGLIINKVDMPQFRKQIKDYDYFKLRNLSSKHSKNLKQKKVKHLDYNIEIKGDK